jgi:hypothetical protein
LAITMACAPTALVVPMNESKSVPGATQPPPETVLVCQW